MTNLEKIKELNVKEMTTFLDYMDVHGMFSNWYCRNKCPYRQSDGRCSAGDDCEDSCENIDTVKIFLESEVNEDSESIFKGTY